MEPSEVSTASPSPTSGRQLRVAITIGALVAILLRLVFPTLFERIDFVTVALLVVASIPWLSPFVSKISIPGVIEAELRELKREFQETKEEVASVSEIALRSQDIVLLSGAEATEDASKQTGSPELLVELAKEYVSIRGSMPSGSLRTSAMDELFGRMLKQASKLGSNWREHIQLLQSGDSGQQLSGIAYAYAFPAATEISALIGAVEDAKQPFVQYWGLRAIQRALEADGPFSVKDVERLQRLPSAFSPGTDRFLMASSIGRSLRQKRR
ncbi:MAG: hypothetical protein E5V18_06875 [Mesorhizobium sp.]|nr:MAG: hypothetical protein E5V18_06875 [Mesorhizobium sp.]